MSRPVKHKGSWRIRWADHKGQRRSEVHAAYNDAVAALARHQAEAEEIRNGQRPGPPPAKTFNDAADYWLKTRAALKRSREDDESITRRYLRPAFGPLLLKDISIQRVDEFVAQQALVPLHKNTIGHHLTLLISMLHMAEQLGWLAKAPKVKKPTVRLFSKDFEYLRTEDEILRLLRAAKEEGREAFALYATAAYTGMRKGELAGLQWDDVNFEKRLITVQRSFDGPTKTGEVRYVPILDVLLPILREWRLVCPGGLVFPNRDGTMYCEAGRVFQEIFHRVLEAAGFPKTVKPNGRTKWYITFHGLRHTFASHWMMGGGDLFKLQKILGHKSPLMTMRYAHLAPDAFAADYGRLGGPVRVEVAEVVALPTAGPQVVH